MRAGHEEMGRLSRDRWGWSCPGKDRAQRRWQDTHAVLHNSMLWPPLCSLLHAVEILILPGQLEPLSSVVPSQRCQNRTCVSLGSSNTFFVPCSRSHSAATIHCVVPAKYHQEHSSGSNGQCWGGGGVRQSWRSSSSHSC